MNWLVRLRSISKEFLKALGKGHTYNIRRNYYIIFGILWGIPVPIVTIGMGLYFSRLVPSFNNIVSHVANYPIHIFFLLHPVLFAVVFGAMGTVRDEKERQRLEFEDNLVRMNEKLKEANEKLKKLDELKDNFVSMVSHELLTPITTIQGYITFLKGGKGGVITDNQKEALEIASEQTTHLIRLIEELMDLSKIELGEFKVRLGPVNIETVVKEVKDSIRQSLEDANIALEDKLPKELPLVLADEERISQVFSNLLGNAIKFTPSGGRISISVKEKGDKVEFCIGDTGIGIPKDKIDYVFDRFYQVDSTNKRRFGGVGLGLAITKDIIRLHRGRIWVESEVGKGSKFFFELEKYDKSRRGTELSTV